jgi:hypothetical protein
MAFRLREWFDEVTQQGSVRGTRFRNGDRPPRNTFKDLTDSILFRSDPRDRAKEEDGILTLKELNGHVVASTDSQAKSNASKPLDRTLVVQPSQLPTVNSEDEIEITGETPYQGETIKVEVNPSDDTKNDFLLSFSSSFKDWLQQLVSYIDTTFGDISTSISNLAQDISNNASNISTNSTNISNNASNISTNATNIGNNANEIQNNASEISNLSSQASQNSNEISTLSNEVSNVSSQIGNLIFSTDPGFIDNSLRDANNRNAPYVKCEVTFPKAGAYSVQISACLNIDLNFSTLGGDKESIEVRSYIIRDNSAKTVLASARETKDLDSTVFQRFQSNHSLLARADIFIVTPGSTITYFIGLEVSDAAGNYVNPAAIPKNGAISAIAQLK